MISCFCNIADFTDQAKVVHCDIILVTFIIQFINRFRRLIEQLVGMISLIMVVQILKLVSSLHRILLLAFSGSNPDLLVLIFHKNLSWSSSILYIIFSLNLFDFLHTNYLFLYYTNYFFLHYTFNVILNIFALKVLQIDCFDPNRRHYFMFTLFCFNFIVHFIHMCVIVKHNFINHITNSLKLLLNLHLLLTFIMNVLRSFISEAITRLTRNVFIPQNLLNIRQYKLMLHSKMDYPRLPLGCLSPT